MLSVFTSTVEDGSWSGGGQNLNAIDTSSLAVFSLDNTNSGTSRAEAIYYDMLVTSISETFSEGESRHDVMTDSYVSFATGANPIKVQINGFLVRTPQNDHRTSFLEVYESSMRGTSVEKANTHLSFMLKQSCYFRFSLHSLTIIDSADYPEYVQVALTGIAYDYMVVPINDFVIEG